nr:hypothetical protein [uncultured Holophaga sp.]
MRIALVTRRQAELGPFAEALAARGASIDWLPSAAQAVEEALSLPRQMVILDDPEGAFRTHLSDLMEANPMLHTAVLTPMEEEAFHEASEGLGVLCALPPTPGDRDAADLLSRLQSLGAC